MTLKQARLLSGKTQAEMANILGVHRSTYIRLEQNPKYTTIYQAKIISSVTKIPYDDIFFAD